MKKRMNATHKFPSLPPFRRTPAAAEAYMKQFSLIFYFHFLSSEKVDSVDDFSALLSISILSFNISCPHDSL